MRNTNLSAPPPTISEANRLDRLVDRLQRQHGLPAADVCVVRAPLRISPLGAHIDHQLGCVTGMTIDQSVLLAFAPATDDQICVESLNFKGATSFALGDIPPFEPGDWGNYLRGAAQALHKTHNIGRGLIGVIDGSLPIGGLSSSAAVTVAYLLALEVVNDLTVAPLDNVDLVTRVEHDYIGLRNGILDQTTILFGRKNHLTHIDCQSRDIMQIPVADDAATFDILVVYSGLSRAEGLVGTGYNSRVAECQTAARQLGDPSVDPRLRHVAPETFAARGNALPTELRRRATHYFGEMQRVTAGVHAWRAGDLAEFGALMNQSGASSVNQYECGSPQLITLYEILSQQPGVHGARFSGAGFRGSCVALIDPAACDEIINAVHERYPVAHPQQAERYSLHLCHSADAAQIL